MRPPAPSRRARPPTARAPRISRPRHTPPGRGQRRLVRVHQPGCSSAEARRGPPAFAFPPASRPMGAPRGIQTPPAFAATPDRRPGTAGPPPPRPVTGVPAPIPAPTAAPPTTPAPPTTRVRPTTWVRPTTPAPPTTREAAAPRMRTRRPRGVLPHKDTRPQAEPVDRRTPTRESPPPAPPSTSWPLRRRGDQPRSRRRRRPRCRARASPRQPPCTAPKSRS